MSVVQSMQAQRARTVREIKVWSDGDVSVLVPIGPCKIEQVSPERVLLRWSQSGSEHLGWVPPERCHQWIADGDLELTP